MQPSPLYPPSRQSLGGTYQVLLELGRGGMGRVLLARAVGVRGFERLVVLKRIHEHLNDRDDIATRFLDEARIASYVHHANVVGIQHAGEDDEGFFLVLDYVEGESLYGLLDGARDLGERVETAVMVRIFLDALSGLHAIHEAVDVAGAPLGILHRDVSPDNLLIGRDGNTRLTDFGIAKETRSRGRTDSNSLVGKPMYMAPEYLRRLPFDRRIDVYAASLSMWVGLADLEPWGDVDAAQLIAASTTDGVPALRRFASHVPAEIAAVVDKGCALDSAQRYHSAHEMHEALSRAARATCGIAEASDVAQLVERLSGSKLDARRRAVAQCTAETPQTFLLQKVKSGARDIETLAETRASDPVDAALVSTPRPPSTPPAPSPRPRRFVVIAVAVGVLGLAAAMALIGLHLAEDTVASGNVVAPLSPTNGSGTRVAAPTHQDNTETAPPTPTASATAATTATATAEEQHSGSAPSARSQPQGKSVPRASSTAKTPEAPPNQQPSQPAMTPVGIATNNPYK